MNPVLLLIATAGSPTLDVAAANRYPPPFSMPQNFGVLGISLAVTLACSLISTRYIAPRLSEKARWIWAGSPVWLAILLPQCVPMALGWRPFDSSVLAVSLATTAAGVTIGAWLQLRAWPPRQVPAPPPDRWPSDRSSA